MELKQKIQSLGEVIIEQLQSINSTLDRILEVEQNGNECSVTPNS